MAVNVKTESVTSTVSSGDYCPSEFARSVEIHDDSPPDNDIDICMLLSDIDLSPDQTLLKNVSSETIYNHNDDSMFSLSCLLNEEVLNLLEDASDKKDGNKCSTESKSFNMLSFENSDVTLSCLAESHLKFEKKDSVHLKLDDLDDGLLPDIDLNFCIKKSDAYAEPSNLGSSPDTVDSGFAEENLDVATLKDNILSFGVKICKEKKFTSVLSNPKPSLLSKSLSYSVKSNILKSEKVKNIRRELIKNHFRIKTFLCQDFSPQANITSMIEDRSNHCVFNINNINNIRCEPKNYFDSIRPFSDVELLPQEKSIKMLGDSSSPSPNNISESFSESRSPSNSFLVDDFPPLGNSAKMLENSRNHNDFDKNNIMEDRSEHFKNNFPSNSFLGDDFPPLEKSSECVEGSSNHGVLNNKKKKNIRSEPVRKNTKAFPSDDFPALKKATKTYKDKLNHSSYKIKNMKNKLSKNNLHAKTYFDDFPPLEKLTK